MYAEQHLEKSSRGFFVCPYCGSGEKRNKTGALKVYRDGRFKCFSCDKFGDIFDLVSKVENLTFMESVARVNELYGGMPVAMPEKKTRKRNVRNKYKDYIEQCQSEVNGAKEYLKKRGFSKEDAKRFSLGYDSASEGVVIPYGKNYSYYLRRSVKDKFFYKPPSDEAGPEPIYNSAALQDEKPCFVCESPIDAISVMIASECNAIAIGGTGVKKLVDYIDAKGIKAPLVVSLDDDEGKERNIGLETAKTLMGELAGRGIPFVMARYSKDLYPKTRRKDANDMLCSRREIFEHDVEENARRAKLIKTLMTEGVI